MANTNENFRQLPGNYMFSEVERRVRQYQEDHPGTQILRLGIGDVTLPIVPAVIDALHRAVDEMGRAESFHGYAPDHGYAFLREVIARKDYQERGCAISPEEIFVSDGAKSDCGSIQELFSLHDRVAVCDPVYPVYVDSNVMAGRAGTYDERTGRYRDLVYMPCTQENGFVPELPGQVPDLIYLCFPNNPTGAVMKKEQLQAFVDYANRHGSVILYDAAYEAYISEEGVVHSIYECEGARACAVEFRSFSKTAGFTGLRLGFTVVPKDLVRSGEQLWKLWSRRQSTRYNGAPYVIQRAGEAAYSPEGRRQIEEQIAFYRDNAAIIRKGLEEAGAQVYGGVNAPYIWLKAPSGMSSWEYFDQLLEQAHVVGIPGSGFGSAGEGYLRLSSFGSRKTTIRAVDEIRRKVLDNARALL